MTFPRIDLSAGGNVFLFVLLVLAVLKLLYMLYTILNSLDKITVNSNSPIHEYCYQHVFGLLKSRDSRRAINKELVYSCSVTVLVICPPKWFQLAWVWVEGGYGYARIHWTWLVCFIQGKGSIRSWPQRKPSERLWLFSWTWLSFHYSFLCQKCNNWNLVIEV